MRNYSLEDGSFYFTWFHDRQDEFRQQSGRVVKFHLTFQLYGVVINEGRDSPHILRVKVSVKLEKLNFFLREVSSTPAICIFDISMDWWTLLRRYIDFVCTCFTGYIYFLYTKRFTKRKPRDDLTPLDDITQISQTITRVLGQNPGPFTLQGTNTYLIGKGNKKLLIDAGEANNMRYISKIQEALGEATIEGIICTHWHYDHTGGCPLVQEYFTTSGGEKPKVYKMKHIRNKNVEGCYYVDEGYVFRQDGLTLKVIDCRNKC
ncbi:unnamed protein product [Strongylus vulgaris]|uniref:Metallo-beta-lactamase domain-containing protein n=1 Tax=Strongylus vulgaris TaxID=40348 RepID=A0A3P7L4L6_STRVU|nr:unnamed protein product [Strongylus vulgaris]